MDESSCETSLLWKSDTQKPIFFKLTNSKQTEPFNMIEAQTNHKLSSW